MPSYNSTSTITPWSISSDYRIAALSGDFTNNNHHVWLDLTITYSFPDGPSYFNNNSGYGRQNEIGIGWSPLTSSQKDTVRSVLNAWQAVSGIRFVEVDDDLTVGDMRFALTGAVPSTKFGHAYQPTPNVPESGDVWLTSRWASQSFGSAPSQTSGTSFTHDPNVAIKYQTLMHEIGHGLGLSHPHTESDKTRYTAPLPLGEDSLQATVMSYAPYTGIFGAPYRGIPTTPMPLDILAIQHMYGANLTTNNGNNTYRFDMSDVRLETIYDTGGNDTIMATNRLGYFKPQSWYRETPDFNSTSTRFNGYRGVQIDLREGAGLNYLQRDGAWGGWGGNKIGFIGHYASTAYVNEGTITSNPTYGLTYINDWQNIFIAFGTKIENAIGTDGDDILVGNALANRFTGNGGNDRIDGMEGVDTAVYSRPSSDFTVTRTASGYDVRANFTERLLGWEEQFGWSTSPFNRGTMNPTDLLRNVERLEFTNQSRALDLAVTQSAGKAARIVGALLDTQMLTPEVAGIAISFFDKGQSMLNVAQLILNHPVYLQSAGSTSNTALVVQLFKNIANTMPTTPELQYYTGLLDRGEVSQAQLAVTAAESSFNEANIGLVGLQNSGLVFTPYLG